MNKREAKKVACRTAASLIHADLASGAEYSWTDDYGAELSSEDVDRVVEAMEELADELDRRGGQG